MADMTDLDSILQRPLRLDKIALDDSISWLELVYFGFSGSRRMFSEMVKSV